MKQRIYRIDNGDPNGFIKAKSPAICYTKQGGLWVKVNDGDDQQGWLNLIASGPNPPQSRNT